MSTAMPGPGQPPPYYGPPYQHPFPTDPADAPAYGTSFGTALVLFFRKYAQFTGRASRSEFWWMFLWQAILGMAVSVLMIAIMVPAMISTIRVDGFNTETQDAAVRASANLAGLFAGLIWLWVIVAIIGLALIVPYLAISVRRLHDADMSGHFLWLILVPSVGQLVVLILCVMPSVPHGQRFDRPLALHP